MQIPEALRGEFADFVVWDERTGRAVAVSRDQVGDRFTAIGVDPALTGTFTLTLADGSYGTAPRLAVKGALLADIAGFSTAFGMTPDEGTAEVEDHIAAELEFMSVLAVKEAAALAENAAEHVAVTQAAQRAFFHDHLGQWATTFAEALHARTASAYLQKAADLLTAWLARELGTLGVDVVRPLEIRQTGSIEDDAPFACPMAGGETG
jgi:hypothetical protein